MPAKIKNFTFLILLTLNTGIFSQSFDVKKFTVEDGLFSNSIDKIFQDSKGILWIKCGKGICSYDGRKIEQYSDGSIVSGDGNFTEVNTEIHYPSSRGIVYIKNGKFVKEKIDSSLCIKVFKDKEAVMSADHLISKDGFHIFNFGQRDSILNFYKGGKINKVDLVPYIKKYGAKSLIKDNNQDVWITFCKPNSGSSQLFKIKGNSLEEPGSKILIADIKGIFKKDKNEFFSNDKEAVLIKNGKLSKFTFPVNLIPDYYSDNIVMDNNGDFWMPFTNGLLKINDRGVSIYENGSRKSICDSIMEPSYDENGKEKFTVKFMCEDLLFTSSIAVTKNNYIVTGNELLSKDQFVQFFPVKERLEINDILVDLENQIWVATSIGLFKCNLSIIQKTNEKLTIDNLELMDGKSKKVGNGFIQTSTLRIYENDKVKDSVPIIYNYKREDGYSNKNPYKNGKVLKNGVLIVFQNNFSLYHDGKMEDPDTLQLQKNKAPLIIHQPNRSINSPARYVALTTLDGWFYFNFQNYIYKTDGKELFCFGREIGIRDTINYFFSLQKAKNDNDHWIDHLLATNKKLYSLKNDKLTEVPSTDLVSDDISSLYGVQDSKNRKYFIKKIFNNETKIYSYGENKISELKIDNPQKLSFLDFSDLIKTKDGNKYVFHTRQPLIATLSFENEKPIIKKIDLPDKFNTTYGSIEFIGDNLIILPLDEPMHICRVDLKNNIITNIKTFEKFNNFEMPEVVTTDNSIIFSNYIDQSWSRYKIDFSKSVFNQTEPITTIQSLKYICAEDTVEHFEFNNIEVPYNFNPLIINFKGVCLSDGSKLLFKYFLDGVDKNWHTTSEEQVNFSTLPAGTYKFKLMSCNNDGLWNKTPVEFSFTILPPWYRTWYAYCCYAFAFVAAIRGYIRNRTKKLEKEKKKLEATVEERTAEVVQQKHLIEEKHKEITDSIHYAKRIQTALLPTEKYIDRNLNDLQKNKDKKKD